MKMLDLEKSVQLEEDVHVQVPIAIVTTSSST